jgi:hypothetical protein
MKPIPTPALPLKGRVKLYFSPFMADDTGHAEGETKRGMGHRLLSILL